MANFPMLLTCRKTELAKRLSNTLPTKYWGAMAEAVLGEGRGHGAPVQGEHCMPPPDPSSPPQPHTQTSFTLHTPLKHTGAPGCSGSRRLW